MNILTFIMLLLNINKLTHDNFFSKLLLHIMTALCIGFNISTFMGNIEVKPSVDL